MIKFRVELALAGIFVVLAAVTLIWPTWIESIFEMSPDGGSGETEWWIVIVFGLLAAIAAVMARRDYLAIRRASPPPGAVGGV